MSANNLKSHYLNKIRPELSKKWELANILMVPKVTKVVINMGIGQGADDKGALKEPSEVLAGITGQKPKVAPARISVAGFRLRQGSPIGLVVTLRGARMYDFLEKLFKVVLPRLRDFQGVATNSFDGRGNYNLGIPEWSVFPEVDAGKISQARGFQITIVTDANDDQKAKQLLTSMGMPFEKGEKNKNLS
jgi:large subunit ribosomal protein L5